MPLMKDYAEFSSSISGFRQMVLLNLAINLDLATKIEDGATTVDKLARRCKVNKHGLEIALDALCAIGLFKKVKGEYRNGPAAKKFLASQSSHCQQIKLAHSICSTLDWTVLPEVVKHGTLESQRAWEKSPKDAEMFTRAMNANGEENGIQVAAACNLGEIKSMIDLGGAAGAFSLAFKAKYPDLNITLFEHPLTLRAAKKILKEKGYSQMPMRFKGGNFFTDPLGGPYDSALLSNVIHIFDKKQNVQLFRRVRQALNPGGAIIIHDFLLDKDKTGPLYAALFSVHMLVHTPTGQSYSGDELKEMLERAGFKKVTIKQNVTITSGVVIARCG